MKVQCAKAEMEMKIFESQQNIERLKSNIDNQDSRCEQLKIEISKLKGELNE